MTIHFVPIRVVRNLAFVAGLSIGFPCIAQAGFFEDLFGPRALSPAQSATPAPSLESSEPRYDRRSVRRHPRIVHKAPKHKTIATATNAPSTLQKTTGLLNDPTLRPGDAIMTKDGIRIYAGKRSATHTVEQFVKLDATDHLKRNARTVLGQIDDAARSDLGRERELRSPVIGRSVAIDGQTREGLRGRIRYVGP